MGAPAGAGTDALSSIAMPLAIVGAAAAVAPEGIAIAEGDVHTSPAATWLRCPT